MKGQCIPGGEKVVSHVTDTSPFECISTNQA